MVTYTGANITFIRRHETRIDLIQFCTPQTTERCLAYIHAIHELFQTHFYLPDDEAGI